MRTIIIVNEHSVAFDLDTTEDNIYISYDTDIFLSHSNETVSFMWYYGVINVPVHIHPTKSLLGLGPNSPIWDYFYSIEICPQRKIVLFHTTPISSTPARCYPLDQYSASHRDQITFTDKYTYSGGLLSSSQLNPLLSFSDQESKKEISYIDEINFDLSQSMLTRNISANTLLYERCQHRIEDTERTILGGNAYKPIFSILIAQKHTNAWLIFPDDTDLLHDIIFYIWLAVLFFIFKRWSDTDSTSIVNIWEIIPYIIGSFIVLPALSTQLFYSEETLSCITHFNTFDSSNLFLLPSETYVTIFKAYLWTIVTVYPFVGGLIFFFCLYLHSTTGGYHKIWDTLRRHLYGTQIGVCFLLLNMSSVFDHVQVFFMFLFSVIILFNSWFFIVSILLHDFTKRKRWPPELQLAAFSIGFLLVVTSTIIFCVIATYLPFHQFIIRVMGHRQFVTHYAIMLHVLNVSTVLTWILMSLSPFIS